MHDSYFNPLFAYWRHAWIAAALSPSECEPSFHEIEYRYNEQTRSYHTLDHLTQFLKQAERLMPKMFMTPAFVLACFWHDFVYDTTKGDNEEQSAAVAERTLKAANASPSLSEQVSALILSTKSHVPADSFLEVDSSYFIDCDISILAASPEHYAHYAKAIRAEYSNFSDEEFFEGRSKFLKKMLSREHVFFTEPFRMQLEHAARSNMTTELSSLSKSR